MTFMEGPYQLLSVISLITDTAVKASSNSQYLVQDHVLGVGVPLVGLLVLLAVLGVLAVTADVVLAAVGVGALPARRALLRGLYLDDGQLVVRQLRVWTFGVDAVDNLR